jgi:hypothetical protein
MQSLLPHRAPKPYRPRATDILEGFLTNLTRDTVTLSEVLGMLGHRAFGIAIFVFALANLIISNVPGVSTILGLPIVFFSLQMMFGAHQPWLPKFLAEKQFRRESFENIIHRSVRVLRKMEIFIKPRLLFLVVKNDQVLGLICFVLSAVLILPILFGNWLPSWGLALIALGMIERDGLLTLIGFIFGLAAVAYAIAFFLGFAHLVVSGFNHFIEWVMPG